MRTYKQSSARTTWRLPRPLRTVRRECAIEDAGNLQYTSDMKRRKSNGRGGNGTGRTNEILERVVTEVSRMRKELVALAHATNERLDATNQRLDSTNARIDVTNERIDRLIDILAPKLKDHEGRLTRLEKRAP